VPSFVLPAVITQVQFIFFSSHTSQRTSPLARSTGAPLGVEVTHQHKHGRHDISPLETCVHRDAKVKGLINVCGIVCQHKHDRRDTGALEARVQRAAQKGTGKDLWV